MIVLVLEWSFLLKFSKMQMMELVLVLLLNTPELRVSGSLSSPQPVGETLIGTWAVFHSFKSSPSPPSHRAGDII